MRHCSWNNYRDVQSMELARHRHLQSINTFLFFPVWADRGVVGFLCEGSFLHSHLRQTVFILTKSPCLFSRLIFVFAKKRSTLKRKAKWNERGFDIKYCAAHSKHDLLLKAQPDFADLKLEVLFWFFFLLPASLQLLREQHFREWLMTSEMKALQDPTVDPTGLGRV